MPTCTRQAVRDPPPERLLRAVAITGTLAAGALAIIHAGLLLGRIDLGDVARVAAGLAIGAAAADFVAATLHWACDTWGDEETAWVGPGLIRSYREHHHDPRAMLAHDWIEVNWQAASASAVGLLLITLPALRPALADRPALHASLVSLLVVSAFANQLHAWAHMLQPPHSVRWLQRTGLLLSRRAHADHHHAPHMAGYCIATGWLNRPLDHIGFWRTLERTVSRLTGAEPRSPARPAPRGC